MISLTEFRERWSWLRTIYATYPTWAKFSEQLHREKDVSYWTGYDAGYHAAMQDLKAERIGKAAKN